MASVRNHGTLCRHRFTFLFLHEFWLVHHEHSFLRHSCTSSAPLVVTLMHLHITMIALLVICSTSAPSPHH